ncbi:MAG: gliding motility-associated C-terminal domain-containing protein [Bacteroidales bacterium]|nr:gliding motility-associated C-terminal domain-containing protein [Bacteroidales bacterium]MCF8456752.1 gliding motility-associated C-terminal domain-containing protein [Bacteroidales bacterium]
MKKLLTSLLFILFICQGWLMAQPIKLVIPNSDTTICMGTSALLECQFDTMLYETTSYTFNQIPHNPLPLIGTSVASPLVDDHYWGPFPIGFEFCFFGQTYTQFYAGANGWISFQPLSSLTYDPWVTQAIPNPDPSRPRACVMAPYRDWYPGTGAVGDIKYATVGNQPGNKKLIVSWIDVPLFSCTGTHGTFQVVLHQSSNYIDNHLISVPTCPGWNSGNGVQGIQNALGTQAYVVPGRNNTNWQASAESWRYKPNGPPQPQVFSWTANGQAAGTGSTLLVTPPTTTQYIVNYEPCGNFVFADTVTVTPEPCGFLTISSTDAICNGQASGTATVVVSEGIAPFDFSWTDMFGNTVGTTLASTDSVNTITNLLAGTYYVTVSMLGGAYDLTETISLGEPQAVIVSLATTPETCPGAGDGTITSSVTNGIPPFVFACQGQPSSFPTNVNSFTFENLPKGNYNLTITDVNGCQGTGQIEVAELHLEFTTSQSEIKCHGDTNALAYISVTGGVTPYIYTWSPIGGNAPGITNLGAGTYFVTVTDENGCAVNTFLTFAEPPPVSIYTSADKTICYGQSANITSTALGGTTPYNYIWTPGGYITQSITVDPIESDEYCVSVTDAFGCPSATKCISVFVNPVLEIEADVKDDTICQGDTTSIFAHLSGGDGGPYLFQLYNGPIVSPPFKVSPDITTKYIIIGSDNCNTPIVKDTVQIIVKPAPFINITSSKTKGCQPLTIQFSENSPDVGQTYLWDFSDSDIYNYSASKNPVHVFQNPGIYEVSLKVISPWNCTSEAQHHEDIIVYPKPISLFYADPVVTNIIDPIVSFSNQSVDVHTSRWAFGDGDSVIAHTPYPHSFPPEPGKFTVSLIAITAEGCRDTSYQTITIEEKDDIFYIANAFNPYSNVDGNTIFKPVISLLDENSYHFYIYNRWGELIFETNDIDVGWDGTYGSDACQVGSYTWLAIFRDLNGKDYRKTGTVTIVK